MDSNSFRQADANDKPGEHAIFWRCFFSTDYRSFVAIFAKHWRVTRDRRGVKQNKTKQIAKKRNVFL